MNAFFEQKIKNPLIFLGVLLFIFIILCSLILITKNINDKTLKKTIQIFFDKNTSGELFVGQKIKSELNCWKLQAKQFNNPLSGSMAVLQKLTTVTGPVSVIYIYNPQTKLASFIGVIGEAEKNSSERNGITPTIKDYWKTYIEKTLTREITK